LKSREDKASGNGTWLFVFGNQLPSICSGCKGNKANPRSRWLVAGHSGSTVTSS
jgi:hypothetical protein